MQFSEFKCIFINLTVDIDIKNLCNFTSDLHLLSSFNRFNRAKDMAEDEALPPPLVVDLVFETLKFLLLERQQIPK